MKKKDPKVADPAEDYQGPTNSGYFVWRKKEDGAFLSWALEWLTAATLIRL